MAKDRSVPVALLAALAIAAAACGSEDEVAAADVSGLWLECASTSCEVLRDSGISLTEEGELIEIEVEGDGQPDPAALSYCEIPSGSYSVAGGTVTLEKSDSEAAAASYTAMREGDVLVLTDDNGVERRFLRAEGSAVGLCPGVL